MNAKDLKSDRCKDRVKGYNHTMQKLFLIGVVPPTLCVKAAKAQKDLIKTSEIKTSEMVGNKKDDRK